MLPWTEGHRMRIDAKTVAKLKLPEGKSDAIHFDDTMPGFGLRLRRGAGGKLLRSWIVQYRRGGATRRLLLGSADVLSVEQARAAGKKALAKVALGDDPQQERTERRKKDRDTLQSAITEYLACKKVKPKTLKDMTRYLLSGPAFKPLHAMPLDKVTRKDIASRIVVMEREAGSNIAWHCRRALLSFYVWAMRMGLVEQNPVIATIRPESSKPRERVLSDEELAKIWKACRDDDYGRIVQLLILLGARRQEIGGCVWPEVDLDAGVWTLPAERSKNGKAHQLPLLPMALEIIKSMPHRVTRDHLFGARAGRGFSSWHKGKLALDAKVKLPPWTPHDIRRSVATHMADLGVQPHIIEQILNHQSGHKSGVAGIYNRSSYEREVRSTLALWEDHIRTLVEGGERKIIPLPQTAG
jgi:integrase